LTMKAIWHSDVSYICASISPINSCGTTWHSEVNYNKRSTFYFVL